MAKRHAHTHAIADVTGLQAPSTRRWRHQAASAYGLQLLDDVDAATARVRLGLDRRPRSFTASLRRSIRMRSRYHGATSGHRRQTAVTHTACRNRTSHRARSRRLDLLPTRCRRQPFRTRPPKVVDRSPSTGGVVGEITIGSGLTLIGFDAFGLGVRRNPGGSPRRFNTTSGARSLFRQISHG